MGSYKPEEPIVIVASKHDLQYVSTALGKLLKHGEIEIIAIDIWTSKLNRIVDKIIRMTYSGVIEIRRVRSPTIKGQLSSISTLKHVGGCCDVERTK